MLEVCFVFVFVFVFVSLFLHFYFPVCLKFSVFVKGKFHQAVVTFCIDHTIRKCVKQVSLFS